MVTVVATLAAPLIIGLYTFGSLDAADETVATMFAFWCLPQIFFYGLFTMLGQVTTARGRFGPMAWAPVVNNVVAIATGLAFLALFTVDPANPSSLSDSAIAFLGLGTTLGVALQALVLVPVLRADRVRLAAADRSCGGWGCAGRATWRAGPSFSCWSTSSPTSSSSNLGVRADVAADDANLSYGIGYNAYANAYLIFLLPHSIITVSVVTGMLPGLSSDAADQRLDAVRGRLSEAWRLTAVAIVVAAAGLVALGTDLAGVLFSGGNADPDDARYIGLLIGAFALGLPAFSAQYIALRGFYAFENTRTPFLLQCGIAATNVALALAFYAALPLRARMIGVAVAYSLTYTAGLALSTYVLRRRVGGLDGSRVMRTYVRLVVAAVPAALAAWGVSWLVGRSMGDGLAGSAASLAAGGTVLVGLYLLLARLLHVRELESLTTVLRSRLGR